MGGIAMRRVAEFDALRGMAVLGVLLFHLRPDEGRTYLGMAGVHLFLVLSGYLITNIVINHVDAPNFFRAFHARRILRIGPIYYLTLGSLIILDRGWPDAPSLRGLPYDLTFTQYLWRWPILDGRWPAPPSTVPAFEHSWSMAVEMQFYLLWPMAIAMLRPRRVVPLTLGVIGFGLWFRTLGYDSWILPSNLGALALGGLIAGLLIDERRVARNRAGLSLSFLVAALVGLAYVRWYDKIPVSDWPRSWMLWRESLRTFGFSAIPFGIVGLVAINAGSKLLAPLRGRELSFLGEISYGLYLYHRPVYWLVGGYTIQVDEPWTMGVAKIALTFVVAALSYQYLEKPILALKDRLPYGSKDAANGKIPPPSPTVRRPLAVHNGHDAVGSTRATSDR
jgi:peptidoglycan/LPS O-acetylase OafA/YrhL